MELTGRLTRDAIIKTLPDERQVVNFSLAINDYYKPKGAAECREYTLYVSCNYWKSTGIATKLSKGSVVEMEGRMYVQAYTGSDGEAKASTNFHCNSIKIHHFTNRKCTESETIPDNETAVNKTAIITPVTSTDDDIPF